MRKILLSSLFVLATFSVGMSNDWHTANLAAVTMRQGVTTLYYGGRMVGIVRSNGDVSINGAMKGQIRSNGDIYRDGRRVGEIRSNGDIYQDGRKVGEVRYNGDVYQSGRKVGEVRPNGDVYRDGRKIGEARNMLNAKQAAVLFFYGFFSL